MQALFDLLPAVVFFVAYRFFGIYAATAAIMATMALQLAYQWFRHRKVTKLFLVTAIVVWVFGAITLILRNPLFIQWKPTIVNWFFALAFLGSHVIGQRKTLIERTMGEAFAARARRLPATECHVDRGVHCYRRGESICRVSLFRGDVGRLQGLRNHWPHDCRRAGSGAWVYFKSVKSDPQQDQ